ncbi:hypothetical protein C6A34_03275 [Bacillus thuringiensis]|nr:hypothetical protein C6A34_03275 [Bacillus thuringiensis]
MVEKPKNAEGKYVEGTQEVIYVYEKIEEPKPEVEGSVVTKYVDKEGKEIAQRNTTTDKVGNEYTTENKEIPGYKLVEKPKNAEGKYVEGTQEVIYVYEKIEEPKPEVEGSVVTKYVDKEGKEIAQRNITTDQVGKGYTTENKEIPGYKLVEKPKNAEGKYVEGTQEVIYVYEKIEEPKPEVEGSVVTKYVDKEGKEIAQRNTTTDKIGNEYTTENKEIPGYNLVEKPKNAEGKYVEGTQEVIYVYEKIEEPKPEVEGSVVTKYVDKEGKEIAQRNTTTDKVGNEYTTENKEIPGYKLVEKPKNAEGKYVEGTQEVIYVYEKIEEPKPEVEGSVVTKYVDKEGKEIAQRNITTDQVGKGYTTENKEIPGYKLVEKPKNAEGKYVEGTTEVIYVYEKIEEPKPEVEGSVVTKYVDKEGKEIAQRNTTTDQVGKGYTTENKEIPGYKLVGKPKNAEGKYVEGTTEVIYVYEKVEEPKTKLKEGSVITKYVDKEGNEIIAVTSTTDKIGNNYKTDAKEIPGYKLVEKPKNAKGKYVEGTTEVIYVYEKVEELNVPMDPKDSNNLKDESLKKEKPMLPKTGAKEASLFGAILCILSGAILLVYRFKKNF